MREKQERKREDVLLAVASRRKQFPSRGDARGREGGGGGRNFPPPPPYTRTPARARRGVNLSSRRKIPSRERERLAGERRERESENLPLPFSRTRARGREGEGESFPPASPRDGTSIARERARGRERKRRVKREEKRNRERNRERKTGEREELLSRRK